MVDTTNNRVVRKASRSCRKNAGLATVLGLKEALPKHRNDPVFECWHCQTDGGLETVKITSEDWGQVQNSGLSLDTLSANGVHSEVNVQNMAELLNRSQTDTCCRGGLVFPYRDLEGKDDGFNRVRPHYPRTNKNGKLVKYEHPAGVGNRAYFPAATLSALNDPSTPIIITEGEKKALALSQINSGAVVGLGGVYNWKNKGKESLIDDLQQINWTDRTVFIVFDYDWKAVTRKNVSKAKKRLAAALRKAGAREVCDVVLPPSKDRGKQGVDDFLVAEGSDGPKRLKKLIQVATPVATTTNPIQRSTGRTDANNAAFLIEEYGDDLFWIGRWKKWFVWDGRCWKVDYDELIIQKAKRLANSLWDKLFSVVKELHHSEAVATFKFVTATNARSGINSMVELARSEVPCNHEELDSDPWLLNLQNGTLDLRTGKLRSHYRGNLLTKLAPVEFDCMAKAPVWQAFLQKVFKNDAELIEYIQRLVGVSLTGVTQEHILPFLFGGGANGKTTFVEAILKLLGSDYAQKAATELLMESRGDRHPTEIADLFGARFVATVETSGSGCFAESKVKELTGGDKLKARRMREDFWEFTPTHKLWIAGNEKPKIFGTDHGIWRRLKLIPFEVTITEAEQDKTLPDKLEAELPGILNWALEGCLEWQRNGLQEPASVTEATQKYALEEDEVGQFIRDPCNLGSKLKEEVGRLWDTFQTEFPDTELTKRAFGKTLGRKSIELMRGTGGKHFRVGISVK